MSLGRHRRTGAAVRQVPAAATGAGHPVPKNREASDCPRRPPQSSSPAVGGAAGRKRRRKRHAAGAASSLIPRKTPPAAPILGVAAPVPSSVAADSPGAFTHTTASPQRVSRPQVSSRVAARGATRPSKPPINSNRATAVLETRGHRRPPRSSHHLEFTLRIQFAPPSGARHVRRLPFSLESPMELLLPGGPALRIPQRQCPIARADFRGDNDIAFHNGNGKSLHGYGVALAQMQTALF